MLQSTILYKVSDPGNLPLDRNGVPVSASGLKQAIAVLEGTNNPDPSKFEVVATFTVGSMFRGVKTFRLDPDCEVRLLRVTPARIDVSNGPKPLFLVSGSQWTMQPQNLAVITPSSGPRGGFVLEASPGSEQGQGWITFTNSQGATARVYVINLPGGLWILEDGTWNNSGIWMPGGIWNY